MHTTEINNPLLFAFMYSKISRGFISLVNYQLGSVETPEIKFITLQAQMTGSYREVVCLTWQEKELTGCKWWCILTAV